MIAFEDNGWQLPAFEELALGPKRHDHALVIPVINEGERIRAQLAAVAAADLPVDVVIADGGSTDGSLDPAFLESVGVRALLTKTGPGKLSAQLRMAYAWCLREGYEGIVTIDGNGKDNVEAVAAFVAKLREGYDYVQGSRYLPGGAAINTPLERTIGNRLIHAPLLSLAAGRRFTDTTNGFRAYSARYLLDPRVEPFREVFGSYNLLFYLTVRASRLGLGTAEIPVARSYPDDGKVPTKIAGWPARLALLSEALNAATGAYAPPQDAPRARPAIAIAFALLVAALIGGFCLAMRDRILFSPDSWTYWELARSIPRDFFRTHLVRQFWMPPDYSASFPPLWPTLLFLGDRIANWGAAGGYFLACLSAAGFVATSEGAGRRVFSTRWIGLAAAVLVLSHAGMIEEIVAGRTIPLQMLLFTALLWALAGPLSPVRTALIGGLVGLTVMNRFDAMPLLIVVTLAVPLIAARRRIPKMLAYLAALLVVLSPWIAYSRAHFGRWFATDNSQTALSARRGAFITDWWPQPQATVFDAPLDWLAKVAANLVGLVPSFMFSPGPLAVFGWLVALAAIYLPFKLLRVAPPPAHLAADAPNHRALWVMALGLAAIVPGYVVTGYFDARYFVPQIWFLILLGMGMLATRLASREQRDLFGAFSAIVALCVTALVLAVAERTARPSGLSDFPEDHSDAEVRACLAASPVTPTIVGKDVTTARWSALYGWRTVMLPANLDRLTPEDIQRFVAQYRITHIDLRGRGDVAALREKFGLHAAPGCPSWLAGVSGPAVR